MGAASEFVRAVVALVAFLLNVTLDLLHVPLLLPGLLSIYRTASVLRSLSASWGKRSRYDYRKAAWKHFGRMAADVLVVLPFGLAALPRAGALIRACLSKPKEYVWITVNHGLVMVVDLLSVLPFLFTLLTGIRTRRLLRDMRKEIEAARGKTEVIWGLRGVVWEQFFSLLLELLYLPLVAFALVTWRGPKVLREIRGAPAPAGGSPAGTRPAGARQGGGRTAGARPGGSASKTPPPKNIALADRAGIVLMNILALIVDLPYVAMALLMTATLWRAVPYWTDARVAARDRRVWECTWSHFKRWVLDVPAWLGAGLLFATVYRLPGLLARMATRSRMPPGPPLATVTSATVTFPGRGAQVRLRGTKPPELVADKARLHVGDDDWWNAAGAVLGGPLVFAARTMLPMAVRPSMMDLAAGFSAGGQEFDAELRLGTKSEKAASEKLVGALRKIANRFPDAAMDVVLECRGAQLIRLRAKAADMLHEDWGPDTAHELPVAPPEQAEPRRPKEYDGHKARDCYLEDLRDAVASGLVKLALDAFALLGLMAIVALFPWRLPQLFCRLLETKARARQLAARRALAKARRRARGRLEAEILAKDAIADGAKAVVGGGAGAGPGASQLSKLWLRGSWYGKGAPKANTLTTKSERESEYVLLPPDELKDTRHGPSGAPQRPVALGCHAAFYRLCPGMRESMEKAAGEDPAVAAAWEALRAKEDELAGQRDALLSGAVSPDHQAVLEKVRQLDSLAAYVDRMYDDLLGAKPDVQVRIDPFWAGASCRNHGWSEKRVIVSGMVKEAVLDVLGLLSTLGLFLSLVRFVPFMADWLAGRRTWRASCFEQLGQLGLDVLYTLRALIVIVLVYHAPQLVAQALEAVVILKSPEIARRVVERYAEETWEDVYALLKLLTLWKTYKAAVATLVWGLFVPAEMVAVSLQQRISSASLRRAIALATWLALLGYPFAFIFWMAEDYSNSEGRMGSAVGAFCVLLIAIQLLIAWCYGADPEGQWSTVSSASYDIHWSYANANALFNMALEIYQHAALVLDIGGVTFRHAATVEDVASPSLLDFDVDFYEVFFWLAVGAVGIWFVVAALPVVVESIFEICPPSTIESRPLWRMLETAMSTTFSLTIFSNLLRILACTEMDASDGLVLDASKEKNVQCYKGDHRVMALLALLSLAYFVPTATWTRAKIRDDTDKDLDVRFAPIYQFVIFISRFGLAAFVEVYSPLSKWVSLGASLLLNLGLAAFTFGFSHWYGIGPCPLPGIWIARGFGFAAAAWTALVVMFAPFEGEVASVPVVLMAIGIGYIVAIIIAIVFTWQWSTRHVVVKQIPSRDMRLVVGCLLELEAILFVAHGKSAFVPKWHELQEGRFWRRLVRKHGSNTPKQGCAKCLGNISVLGELLLELERAVAFEEEDPGFLRRRPAWNQEAKEIENVPQLAMLILEFGGGLPVVQANTKWASQCSAGLSGIGRCLPQTEIMV